MLKATSTIQEELGTQLVVLGARSYEATGTSVRVEIDPSGIRVISPGPLPEPVTVENIREQNAARNRHVIGHLRRLGIAEDAEPATNSLARERTGLDRHEVLSLLQRLVDEGGLVQVGERRGTRYLLPDQAEDQFRQ